MAWQATSYTIPLILAAVISAVLTLYVWRRRLHEPRARTGPLSVAHEFIVTSTSDGVIVLDAQNHILELNPAAQHLMDPTASEAIGQPVEQVWADWPVQMERSGDETDLGREMVLGRGDEQRVYDVHVSALVDGRDRLISRVAVLRDVSERKQAQEALRELSEELEDRVAERTAELTEVNAELARRIKEREQAEAELVRHNRELLSLQSATAATTSCLDLPFVLDTVTWEVASLLGLEGCLIYEWNQETDTISMIAEYGSTGWEEEKSAAEAYDLADYPLRNRVLAERYAQQMTIGQPDIDPTELAYMQQANIRTMLILPMVYQDRVAGLVEVRGSQVERTFTDREISLAQLLATQAANAVENARLYERAHREITERKRAEEQIKASLKEKEVLLKEIHHRVKNNLQVISSLLNLQSRSVEEPSVLEMFQDSQNRIRSMALIHEKLYRSQDLASIDFAEYIRSLATYLVRSYRASLGSIALKVNADGVFLSIDAAIPCGLIINELISNSLKHAFSDGREGEIRIELRSGQNHQLTLIVGDNGVGFPEDVDFRNTGSLGLQLVNTLTNQLDGTVELHSSRGAEFRITFPAP